MQQSVGLQGVGHGLATEQQQGVNTEISEASSWGEGGGFLVENGRHWQAFRKTCIYLAALDLSCGTQDHFFGHRLSSCRT